MAVHSTSLPLPPSPSQVMTAKPGQWLVYLTVKAPPSTNVAPPSIYWLHVLDQGGYTANGIWVRNHWVPNQEGQMVQVTRK